MKQTFRLVHSEARARAASAVEKAPDEWVVTVSEPNRSLEQNAAQWPLLQAFADQHQLCINGKMEWATADDWKDILTATYKADMRVAVFEDRMILLGQRTSKFGKKGFSEWLEYLHSMAAQMDIDLNYRDAA
jgi:hypothetical protein